MRPNTPQGDEPDLSPRIVRDARISGRSVPEEEIENQIRALVAKNHEATAQAVSKLINLGILRLYGR